MRMHPEAMDLSSSAANRNSSNAEISAATETCPALEIQILLDE
jgi:hypothetical protein